MIELTSKRVDRITKEWAAYAKEPVEIEVIGGAIYAFCSELAALRLFYTYRHNGDLAKVAYSENQKTWFFRLEI